MVNKQTLFFLGLPVMSDMEEFSYKINLTPRTLYHLSTKSSKFYKTIYTNKANGKIRTLHSPSKNMKAVQAWILRNILDKIPVHENATGFIQGKSILINAESHKENKFYLCMDITDFFTNISKKKVYSLFNSLGYSDQVSMILTSLCTYNNELPQGGVTSPALSNLVNVRLDKRISNYVGKRNIVYTRYADDITLSSNNPDELFKAKKMIEKILNDEGYHLNTKKTRLLRLGSSRKVTGLVISDDNNVGVGRRVKRLLRAKIHKLLTTNMDEMERIEQEHHIQGWINFMNSVDKDGVKYIEKYYAKATLKASLLQATSALNQEDNEKH